MLAPDRGLGTSYSYGDAHRCSPLIRKSGAEPFVARKRSFLRSHHDARTDTESALRGTDR